MGWTPMMLDAMRLGITRRIIGKRTLVAVLELEVCGLTEVIECDRQVRGTLSGLDADVLGVGQQIYKSDFTIL